jgi:hypothetical protein
LTHLVRRHPVLMVALALAFTGCGGSSDRTATGPSKKDAAPAATAPEGNDRVTSMAVAPGLGTAGSFAVLGGSTVTNTGPSVLNGDLGVSPGTAIVGFPPGVFTGTLHAADATALSAQGSVTAAYNALTSQACNVVLTGVDLGGLTLTPGVYCFASSAQLTGTLTLDGLGNPGSVWVFQIGSTLTTASNSRVSFINGGQACGAFWQIGSSATLGTTTAFSGNILALTSITLNTGATSNGALFARNGAVTLDTNVVTTVGSCGAGPQPSPTPIPGGPPPPPVPAVPPAAALALLVALLGTGRHLLRR